VVNSILSWGLDVVREIQKTLGAGMLIPMQAITFFGSEAFAIAALPLLYWCVDRKKGARIGILVLFSAFMNLFVKFLFMQPRPYDFDPSVGLVREITPGLPSGHGQMSITFWGGMLTVLPRLAGIIALVLIPLFVGISRLYLGVHFPTDIFAAWGIGGLMLGLFYGFGPAVEALLHSWNLRLRIIAIAIVALAMNFLLPSDTLLAGAFFGSAVGFALASNNLRFDAGGSFANKAKRYFLGIAGTAILYFGPKLVLGDSFASQEALIRFIRYGFIGLWVSYGAPWCFLRLNLVGLEKEPEAEAERKRGYSLKV
jgi:hypothetical protein